MDKKDLYDFSILISGRITDFLNSSTELFEDIPQQVLLISPLRGQRIID